MPQVVAYVGAYVLASVGVTGFVAFSTALIVGSVVLIGAGILAARVMSANFGQVDSDKSRQSTVRGTIEPQKIIYGEALVSGPVVFVGVSGTGNRDLHHVIALAGHEVEAITDIYLDSEIITNPTGNVGSGTFGQIDATTICRVDKYLGTDAQTASSSLDSLFPDYNTNHRGRGIAYIHTTFTLTDASQSVWDKYSPNNIKALVKGRKVYDPRLDVTPGASPTNASYIAYSDNPGLCVADYLTNARFGMRVVAAKIDWDEVVVAADVCDQVVSVPSSTQKRFTANGVLYATDTHKDNIAKLLSAMNGNLIYTAGKYVIRAGAYVAPTETLTEDDLAGPIGVKTSVERSERFNTVGGVFINPADGHKSAEFPQVTTTAALLRDNSEVLEKEIELPFTNSSYMAQRIAHKMVQMSDQQKMVTFPANLAGLRVAVGDRVNLDIAELGWSNKVFQCLGWSFGEDAGVTLTLMEDDAGSYADMDVSDYSTLTAAGVIVPGFPGVPDPQLLTATGDINGIELDWTNPGNTSKFSSIIVYASPTSAWSGAVEIGRGLMTSFYHSAATAADPITSGATRYYWVRAVTTGGELSDRNPDSDTSTVTATAVANVADSVEWVNVGDGGGLRPANNATVGARASVDLKNAAGVVIGDVDVLNSVVKEDITQIQLAGTGDILELVGGGAVDLQQLGDVARYAYDADQVLNGYINSLSTAVTNLNISLEDITAGVADVYIQPTAPVAGVGGVPDPIVTASRWYDSDDSNAPHYFNGTDWVSLEDPRIASNQADITAVSATLNTTNTTVAGHTTDISGNASAISVLDSTVVALDGTVSVLSGDYNAFKADYIALDPAADIIANSAAIDAIDVRVIAAEGTITSSSTQLTELSASLGEFTKLEGTDGEILTLIGGAEIDLQGTSAVGASASSATNVLDARVTDAEGTITSQASSITALTGSLASTAAGLSGTATALDGLEIIVELQGDIITATSTDLLELTGRVDTAEGTLTQLNTVNVTSTSALVQSHLALSADVGEAQGHISQINTVDLTSTSALVQSFLAVSSTVGENTATIETQTGSIDGIEANYGVKVDINGRVTGFGLNSTAATATPTSEFYVIADRFAVVDPASTASAPIVPFTVSGGLITMGTDVRISGDLVTTGTISADRISIDGVTLDTDGLGNLIIAADGVGTSQIAPAAVTINELADSIQSSDYVTGVSGWKITKAGASEFSNVVVRGNVDAGSISINGDYLSVVGGELTVVSAPGTEVTAAGESTDGGTASATVTRVTGGVTTIQVSFRMFDTAAGAVPSPFPVALTLKRGATTIATFDGIRGEFELGGGAEPSVAFGSFGATFYDSDAGTGSTTYNLTCTTSDFSTTFQIIAKSTRP